MFVFLFLTYFTLYERLLVHPHVYRWPNFIPFYSWIIFHCIYAPLIISGGVVIVFHVTHQWVKYLVINLSGLYKWLKFLLLLLKTQPWELHRDTSASLLVNTSHWASPVSRWGVSRWHLLMGAVAKNLVSTFSPPCWFLCLKAHSDFCG